MKRKEKISKNWCCILLIKSSIVRDVLGIYWNMGLKVDSLLLILWIRVNDKKIFMFIMGIEIGWIVKILLKILEIMNGILIFD